MFNKRTLCLSILAVAVLGLIVWALVPHEEPDLIIQGKALRKWLEGYGSGQGLGLPHAKKVDEIVREAGTNAIPTLLQILEEGDDSTLKLKLVALLQKQNLVRVKYINQYRRKQQVYIAFTRLGPVAKDAVPRLVEIYELSTAEHSRNCAACALGAIGPVAKAAVPALLRGASGTNLLLRLNSLAALAGIHAEPELVVPVFMNCLNDTDPMVRLYVTRGLGLFGEDAKQAVPGLVRGLNDPYSYVRQEATNALKLIDPELAVTLGIKQ
jgi:HEAT repeat protein